MDERFMQEKYAELVLRMGVNIQQDQTLVINGPIEGATFVRRVAKKAYELGAKDVHINWGDDELSLLKYKHAPEKVLTNVPDWKVQMQEGFAKEGAAFLSIHATDPDLLQDVNPNKVAKAAQASAAAMEQFTKYIMNDWVTWTVISIPTEKWAEKVFPDKKGTAAIEALWNTIYQMVRVDQEDPIAVWQTHNDTLLHAYQLLNDKQYTALHLQASGTDLTVGLPEKHIWQGGAAQADNGTVFNPNMPTEEVFTAPHKYKVDGTVSSTKPLNYGGSIIDEFQLTFKDGQVIDHTAKQGGEVLRHLLETDEGAKRIGEIALVPDESPISQSGLIFYNTLFDENASCHIALGKAYPTNVEGGTALDQEALDKRGVNDSLVHVDFMIGSDQMNIDGIKADGTKEAVFRNGTWAFEL